MSGFEVENYLQGLKLLADDAYFKGLAEALSHTMLVNDPISHNIQHINRLQPGFTLEAVIR